MGAVKSVDKVYGRSGHPVHLNDLQFRTRLVRPGNDLILDGITSAVDWNYDEGDPTLHGTVGFVMPDQLERKVTIVEGYQLALDVLWLGSWREYWRMRLYDENDAVISGNRTYVLHDDSYMLQINRDDFHYARSKKKGKSDGWKSHQIAVDVLRRFRVPVGKIAMGTADIREIDMPDASPMAVLQRAYAIEKNHTGNRFVIRWQNGRFNILPLQRNRLLYVLKDQLIEATLAHEERDDAFATAGTIRATVGKGKNKHKIVVRYADEKAIAREGFIHKNISAADVDSRAEAREKIKKHIARHGKRKQTIEISHPGLPFLYRGDGVNIDLTQVNRKNRFAFLASGSWSLSGEDFTMDLTMGFDDAVATMQRERRKLRDKKQRAEKRAKRKK